MRKVKRKISKEDILRSALELINEHEGKRSLSIREIAKKMNCSHPNIYNYYSGINEILWDALNAVMKEMVFSILEKVELETDNRKKFHTLLDELILFYLNNKGWYSLIWFENIKGPMPDHLKQTVLLPRKTFCDLLEKSYSQYDLSKIVVKITDIVHSYIQGQMAKYFKGRSFFADTEELRKTVVDTALEIMELYIKEKGVLK